jgi:hypothetical protein
MPDGDIPARTLIQGRKATKGQEDGFRAGAGRRCGMTRDKELREFLSSVIFMFTPMRRRTMGDGITEADSNIVMTPCAYLKFLGKLAGMASLLHMPVPVDFVNQIEALEKHQGKPAGPDGKE